jgi:peptidoglycan/xylan/chitin deacetylase (PgdA/CDA1 family)
MRRVLARGVECLMFGVREYQRLRPRASSGRRPWPVFGVAEGSVALTIDDGPHPQWTPRMLDLLAAQRVKATFFLIGENVARHPALARRIAEAGHGIGNHSMTHPQPFAALPGWQLGAQIDRAQRAIEDAVGLSPKVFRAPSGGWSPAVMRAVAERDLVQVDWTVNPSDWKKPGAARIHRSLSRAKSSHVLLCHDGGGDRSQTVTALASTLPLLRERGLRFVTLEEGIRA